MFAYVKKTVQSIASFINTPQSALLSCLLIFSITLLFVYYLEISMATAVAVTVMMISRLVILAFANVIMMLAICVFAYPATTVRIMLVILKQIIQSMLSVMVISMLAIFVFSHRIKSSADVIMMSTVWAFSHPVTTVKMMLAILKQTIQSMLSVIYSIITPGPIFDANKATLTFSSATGEITKEMLTSYRDIAKKISIPDGVTSIGEDAFLGCISLTTITIPDSVTEIKKGAFWHCWGLTKITIPNSVTAIGGSAFAGCTSLTSITIPNSVTKIGPSAFKGCRSLTSITIPNGVTEIRSKAFFYCKKLKYIIVPERFKNQTSDFWEDRGVDINRTAIYGLQDLIQNTDLQAKVLKGYSEGVNFPVYKSLTLLNPLSYVSVSNLLIASSKLANLTSEPANLCLPRVVLSGGAGLVKTSLDNWKWLLSSLDRNAYACADVLAEWLSIYDIAKIQIAKATAPSQEDLQVILDKSDTALKSKDFVKMKSPNWLNWLTLRKPHTTPPPPKPHGFSRGDQARLGA